MYAKKYANIDISVISVILLVCQYVSDRLSPSSLLNSPIFHCLEWGSAFEKWRLDVWSISSVFWMSLQPVWFCLFLITSLAPSIPLIVLSSTEDVTSVWSWQRWLLQTSTELGGWCATRCITPCSLHLPPPLCYPLRFLAFDHDAVYCELQ